MMNLVGMGIFARVAEAKGFSAAARRLGLSKSLVSKEVALLVDRLHAKPRGLLKCTAPVAFATLHIGSALPEFLAQYPEVQVDLTVGDRFFELAEEGYDLAIRIARKLPPNMVARQLAPINRVVCATEGDIAVPVRGNLRLNDDEVIWQAVLGGLGVSMLPTFTVGRDLQSGRLQAVLTEYIPSERNLYALYLPNRHLSAKVRVFIDFLLARFEPPPYWDRGWSTPNSGVAKGEEKPVRKRR